MCVGSAQKRWTMWPCISARHSMFTRYILQISHTKFMCLFLCFHPPLSLSLSQMRHTLYLYLWYEHVSSETHFAIDHGKICSSFLSYKKWHDVKSRIRPHRKKNFTISNWFKTVYKLQDEGRKFNWKFLLFIIRCTLRLGRYLSDEGIKSCH